MCKPDREREGADRSRLRLLPVTSLHNSQAPSSKLPALRLPRRLFRASQVIDVREGEGARGHESHGRASALYARGVRAAEAAARGARRVPRRRKEGLTAGEEKLQCLTPKSSNCNRRWDG